VIEDTTYEKNFFVHLTDAEKRKACIDEVSYEVELVLPKGDWFGGKVKIDFKLTEQPQQELFLDFRGVKIG